MHMYQKFAGTVLLIMVRYLQNNCWLSHVLNGVIASFDISHKQQLEEVQLLVLVSTKCGALTHPTLVHTN